MKASNKIILLLITLTSFISCQRVIDVEVLSSVPQLVIEGNLTDRQGAQTVTISTSIPYSNSNIFPSVTGATVKFTDVVGNVFALTEKTPGTYTINSYKGKAPNVYFLTVVTGGQTYTAASAMPFPVNLDSLTLTGQIVGKKIIKTINVNYYDPAGVPNQYRFVMYVNGVQVQRVFVDNDEFTDGRPVVSPLFQDDIELKTGDVVDIDMQCIDTNIYNYWFSLSSQGGNTPIDSSTPANPPSNFNNHALGYFSAHTIQRKTVKIP